MTVLRGYVLKTSPVKETQNHQEIEYFDLTFHYVELVSQQINEEK